MLIHRRGLIVLLMMNDGHEDCCNNTDVGADDGLAVITKMTLVMVRGTAAVQGTVCCILTHTWCMMDSGRVEEKIQMRGAPRTIQ